MSGTQSATRQTPRQRARSSARDLAASSRLQFTVRQWPWAAVPFGLFYLILLALHFGAVIRATYLDADTASAPVIGQLFGGAAPHAHVVLGTFGWYSTLLFELATRWLPLHRQIWELAPYGMALAAAALTSWSVWRLAGAAAASLSAVLMVSMAPRTLHLLLSTTEHGPVWFCLALLGALVVFAGTRPDRLPRPLSALLMLLTGLIIGTNAASDKLLVIGGIAPLIVASIAGYALLRSRESVRIVALSAGVLALTGVFWFLTTHLMTHYNVMACGCAPDNNQLASADHVAKNFKLWWQTLAELSNGGFYGAKVSFTSLLMVASAVLGLAAVALLPRLAWNELRPRATRAVSGWSASRLVFVTYWTVSAAFLSLAFLVSAAPVDLHADRYLVGVIFAVAAVIPVVLSRPRAAYRAALVGTIIFALAGIASIANGTDYYQGRPTDAEAIAVERIAVRNHVSLGYSGYWDAAPITWATHFRVRLYPLRRCGSSLCRFYLHVITSWYSPRRGVSSLLLSDPMLPASVAPTRALGTPSAVYRVDQMTIYIYPYDLASKVVP